MLHRVLLNEQSDCCLLALCSVRDRDSASPVAVVRQSLRLRGPAEMRPTRSEPAGSERRHSRRGCASARYLSMNKERLHETPALMIKSRPDGDCCHGSYEDGPFSVNAQTQQRVEVPK